MWEAIFSVTAGLAFLYVLLWAERKFEDKLDRIVDKYRPKSHAKADENGVSARSANQRQWSAIGWTDIVEIEAVAVDKITYRENFLMLKNAEGAGATIGELDEGFADALEMIESKIPGFPTNWYGRLEMGSPGERLTVWVKKIPENHQHAAI